MKDLIKNRKKKNTNAPKVGHTAYEHISFDNLEDFVEVLAKEQKRPPEYQRAVEHAARYLEANNLLSTRNVYTIDDGKSWGSKKPDLKALDEQGVYFQYKQLSLDGYILRLEQTAPAHQKKYFKKHGVLYLAAKVVVTGARLNNYKQRGDIDGVIKTAYDIGKLHERFTTLVAISVNHGKKGGATSKRKQWAIDVACKLYHDHPKAIKRELWAMLPDGAPTSGWAEGAEVYRDGNTLVAKVYEYDSLGRTEKYKEDELSRKRFENEYLVKKRYLSS